MRDLRRAFILAWSEAETMKGDFQDCLLYCLSKNLGMPILNEVSNRVTEEGIEEMCRGVEGETDSGNNAQATPQSPAGREDGTG